MVLAIIFADFSASADSDLDAILAYMITRLCGPKAATDFVAEAEKRYALLEEQPKMFPLSQNLRLRSKDYRKIVIDNFIILYRVVEQKEEIFIVRVFYGKRDYEKYI